MIGRQEVEEMARALGAILPAEARFVALLPLLPPSDDGETAVLVAWGPTAAECASEMVAQMGRAGIDLEALDTGLDIEAIEEEPFPPDQSHVLPGGGLAVSIYVRLAFDVRVDLAEGDGPTVELNGETDAERHRRAVEAAVSWIPQSGDLYLDGEDKDPARIFCDLSDSDVEEVRVE